MPLDPTTNPIDSRSKDEIFMDLVRSGVLSVDSDGRIWRHSATTRGGGRTYEFPERRAECLGKRGYLCLSLKLNRKTRSIGAHRIVWIHFNGPIPIDKEINHINAIRTDNRPSNLEAISHGDNMRHAYGLGLIHRASGEKHPKAKLTAENVAEIRSLYSTGAAGISDLARRFGVVSGTVDHIIHRRTWK
jgi:hypothetical protein